MITINTPYLDEISINNWFSSKYNIEQEKEIEKLIHNHIWITARKVKIPVKNMKTSHIKNCIKCWQGKGKMIIPKGYLGGKRKWLKIFEEELIKRN
jgi:hypothetical protein